MVVLVVLLARGPRLPERLQEHLAATVALVLTSTAVVGAFASRFAPDRVQDRYLFFCAPLLLVALLGVDRDRRAATAWSRSRWGASLAARARGRVSRTRGSSASRRSRTRSGLIPLWTANEHLLGGSYRATVLVVALALVALRRVRPGAPDRAPSRSSCSASSSSSRARSGQGRTACSARARGRSSRASAASSATGSTRARADEIAVLWTGRADRFTVNMNEFFNARVGQVYYTSAPTPGGFGELPITVDAKGLVRTADGKTVDDAVRACSTAR